jgi:regulatory protein
VQRGTPFDCALRVLALRDHSEWELRRKLKLKGYDDEAGVEGTVARLKELGYLDDARFALGFAQSAIRNGRGYGGRLKLELSRRGVAGAIVQGTLEQLAQEFGETEVLARTIERRFAGFDPESATEKEKRKVVAYLQRKGFTLSAILAGLRIHSIY